MAILKELKLKNIYLIIPAVFAVLIVFFAAQEDEEIPELSIEQSSINLEVSIEKNKHSSFYTVEEMKECVGQEIGVSDWFCYLIKIVFNDFCRCHR